MLNLSNKAKHLIVRTCDKQIILYTTATKTKNEGEFRVLNLKTVKNQLSPRRIAKPIDVLPPRSATMPVDQNWGNVWPGPRTFHPATVPIPLRQGFVEKGAPPGKFANAELMKIPNFLHLTPPVIRRQCEALKRFCTPWPKALDSDEKCDAHFPLEVSSSSYCHASPTIRDPMARIVTIRFKLGALRLDARATDKFLRLVGDRYDKKSDTVTIVTDRCPMKGQNYEYAMYLLTALYHESLNVEAWEELKSNADMEYYDWEKSVSKANIEKLFQKSASDVPQIKVYSSAIDKLMNEGESEYTVNHYSEAVRKLLNLPQSLEKDNLQENKKTSGKSADIDTNSMASGLPHHCEIIETHSPAQIMPHYFLIPLIFLGSAVAFSVIILLLIVAIARTRLTPVVLARGHQENELEEAVARAINHFTHLEDNALR